MTPKKWAEAEAMWESGDFLMEDLVKKFGVARSTLERHFAKKGTVKGAKAAVTKKKVEEHLTKAAIDEAAILAARIKETKEEHYKMASALTRLTWAEILEAKKAGHPVAVALNNIKALDAAMTVMKKAREERFAVLGLDRPDAVDPDELPELVIAELTAEQVQQLRDRDLSDLDELPTNQGAVQPSTEDADDFDEKDLDDVVEEG